MLRRRLTLPRVSPVRKGRARCLDCISGVWTPSHFNQKYNPVKDLNGLPSLWVEIQSRFVFFFCIKSNQPVILYIEIYIYLFPGAFLLTFEKRILSPSKRTSRVGERMRYLPKPLSPWADSTLAPRPALRSLLLLSESGALALNSSTHWPRNSSSQERRDMEEGLIKQG